MTRRTFAGPEPGTTIIVLTQERLTVVDDVDADLADLGWHLRGRPGYAARTGAFLHKVIAARIGSVGDEADHINGDQMDNRRCNLRAASSVENSRNRGMRSDNKSGFRGVTWDAKHGRWRAQIGLPGRVKYLGLFTDPAEASRVYEAEAVAQFGVFKRPKHLY